MEWGGLQELRASVLHSKEQEYATVNEPERRGSRAPDESTVGPIPRLQPCEQKLNPVILCLDS